ncbi:MAG: hypothetical protein PHQ05_02235 [Sterolibacterium sp.]|nr:hypothetical protein [Sterolibacterium sp.]
MNRFLIAASVAVVASLIGCGGGGGGGTAAPAAPAASTATFPFAGAVSSFAQTGHDYNLAAAYGGDTYAVQISYKPASQATFEGHAVSTMSESAIIRKNSVVAESSTGTSYFEVSPYKAWGYIASDGSYDVHSAQQVLPSSVTVGQSGALDNVTTYKSSAKTSTNSTSVRTWSIEADTATTAWGCFNETITYTSNSSKATASQCYKVDQSGNVSALKVTFFINGQSLTFQ